MGAVNSTILPLGTDAPDFSLPDPSGTVHSLDELARGAPALVVVFLSNHCPYVRRVASGLGRVAFTLARRGVAVIGIMPNDVEASPEDAPAAMSTFARESGWGFPYLYDESQAVARAYRAACTPDVFVFDGDRRLVYRGQMDGARPANDVEVTGADLLAAVDAVLTGSPPPSEQLPSLGCSIKWKPGNAPGGLA